MARNASSKDLFGDLKFPAAEEAEPVKAKPKQTPPAYQEEMLADEWDEKMSVKKSFWITQKNMEALRLRHTLTATGLREYSRILNEALTEYLEEEVRALEKAYPMTSTPDERYYKALSILSQGKT